MSLDFHDVKVSEEDVEEYWRRGYWISPKLLSDASIQVLRDEITRLFQGDYDRDIYPPYRDVDYDLNSPALRKVVNGWWLNDVLRECVTAPRLGKIGAALMRVQSVRLWHDQIIWKPSTPRNEDQAQVGNVGWHQDYGHWQCASTDNMCTAWIALQDTDLTNGGMRTIVGSHRWGLQDGSNTFNVKDLSGLHEQFGKDREWIDEPCILKAGQASFHHALCFHGSGPNLSSQPRLSVVSHMMPGDTSYRGRVLYHQNVALLGPDADAGTPFSGPCFPRMWPASDS